MNPNRRKTLQSLAAALALSALPPVRAQTAPATGTGVPKLTLNDGSQIPILGYGTWDVRGAEGQKAIETALALGYRHIDTAAMYGNEAIVGAAVRASGIPRHELYITSKIWSDMNKAGAQRTFAASQKALGLDYIDLYLLHQPGGDIYGAWEALSHEQRAGRVKSLGVSNFDAAQIAAFYQRVDLKPVLNQIELNPTEQQHATRRAMAPLGVAVQSYSPFGGAGGVRAMLQRPELVNIGTKHGKTAAQTILRWLVQQNIIAIPKTLHPERMQENLAIFDFCLDEAEMQQIAALDGQ